MWKVIGILLTLVCVACCDTNTKTELEQLESRVYCLEKGLKKDKECNKKISRPVSDMECVLRKGTIEDARRFWHGYVETCAFDAGYAWDDFRSTHARIESSEWEHEQDIHNLCVAIKDFVPDPRACAKRIIVPVGINVDFDECNLGDHSLYFMDGYRMVND